MDQTTLAAAQEIDFSLLALFLRATLTVKIVMLGLMLMSFWSWAIIIQKHILFRAARQQAEVFDRAFCQANLWMNCLKRWDRSPRVLQRKSSPRACWNGGAATGKTAG